MWLGHVVTIASQAIEFCNRNKLQVVLSELKAYDLTNEEAQFCFQPFGEVTMECKLRASVQT